jgi:Rrf2 family cysteine metabolism transcriptional repressor
MLTLLINFINMHKNELEEVKNNMFSISRKGTYGIAAVLELATNYGSGLLHIKDIAQRRNIPKHYLVQLLNSLLKSGIVRSVRGNKGGYELNDDPANVSFLQVLEMLEGEIELEKSYPGNDAVEGLFLGAEKELKKIFDISLAELLLRQQQFDNKVMFHI